jgi:hypothetical protein
MKKMTGKRRDRNKLKVKAERVRVLTHDETRTVAGGCDPSCGHTHTPPTGRTFTG